MWCGFCGERVADKSAHNCPALGRKRVAVPSPEPMDGRGSE